MPKRQKAAGSDPGSPGCSSGSGSAGARKALEKKQSAPPGVEVWTLNPF